MGLNNFFPLSGLLSKERGLPSCIKTAPIPWLEASHSSINVFLKLGVAKMGVLHIAYLIFSKDLVSSSVKENASFFNNFIRGVSI
jgi:hypothetical protein